MASTISYFLLPEDELTFLRALEPHRLEVYPEVFDASYRPFAAGAETAERLSADAYYLALTAAGEAVGRQIRRGPHAGLLEIDEIASPVLHYERSLFDAEGELRSGRLWTELEVVGDRQKRLHKPDLMRSVFEDIRDWFKKRCHRSKPNGFFVGRAAARRVTSEGLQLREAGRKGERVVPYK